MATEIERRFLVRDVACLAGRSGDRIVQGYVAKEPGAMTTRVRLRAGRGYLTLKTPRYGMSRQEFEYEIPADDARCILDNQCGTRLIRKIRYLVPFAAHVFEVDVFEGRHTGLIVAEVELRSEGERSRCRPGSGPKSLTTSAIRTSRCRTSKVPRFPISGSISRRRCTRPPDRRTPESRIKQQGFPTGFGKAIMP